MGCDGDVEVVEIFLGREWHPPCHCERKSSSSSSSSSSRPPLLPFEPQRQKSVGVGGLRGKQNFLVLLNGTVGHSLEKEKLLQKYLKKIVESGLCVYSYSPITPGLGSLVWFHWNWILRPFFFV